MRQAAAKGALRLECKAEVDELKAELSERDSIIGELQAKVKSLSNEGAYKDDEIARLTTLNAGLLGQIRDMRKPTAQCVGMPLYARRALESIKR